MANRASLDLKTHIGWAVFLGKWGIRRFWASKWFWGDLIHDTFGKAPPKK